MNLYKRGIGEWGTLIFKELSPPYKITFRNGGQWPNPNIINCISNESTRKFYRTNIFDRSTLVFVKEIIEGRLLTYQHLTKLLEYTNTN